MRITIKDASNVITLATSITMHVVYQNGEKYTLKYNDICRAKLDTISFPKKTDKLN